ncbi:hypothetical protein AAH991_24695 [Microbispora sp. ZYX-F-249]|uniref:Uncharacterized protein n=1 Tax=Microbispora maris TaxID=3144104 RepID=A0ABV0AU12_9ACTN
MEDHHPARTAVFVDQSGRRAKILTAAAVGGAIVVLALTLTLVSGALTGPELPPMGWVGTQGRQVVERSSTGSPTPSPRSEHRSEHRRVPLASGTPHATTAPARRVTSGRGLPSRVPSASPSPRRRSPKPSTTPPAGREPDVEISSSGQAAPPPSPEPEVSRTTAPSGEVTRTPAPEPSAVQTPPGQPGQTPGAAQ